MVPFKALHDAAPSYTTELIRPYEPVRILLRSRRTHSNRVSCAGCPSGIDCGAILFQHLDAILFWHK